MYLYTMSVTSYSDAIAFFVIPNSTTRSKRVSSAICHSPHYMQSNNSIFTSALLGRIDLPLRLQLFSVQEGGLEIPNTPWIPLECFICYDHIYHKGRQAKLVQGDSHKNYTTTKNTTIYDTELLLYKNIKPHAYNNTMNAGRIFGLDHWGC